MDDNFMCFMYLVVNKKFVSCKVGELLFEI